jgi:four helix bundle protein
MPADGQFAFENFGAWQRAVKFARDIFLLADQLPQRQQYSLGEQLRRASLSVSTNLAEGTGRETNADRRRFYIMARGSAYECASILRVAYDCKYISETTFLHHRREAYELSAIISKVIQNLGGTS